MELSCITELQPGEDFVDYRLEGATEQPTGGWEFGGEEYCSSEILVSVFLVRKADHQIFALGNSDNSDDTELDYRYRGDDWNVLTWCVPNLASEIDYQYGGGAFCMLSGQFVIKATLCSEFERHDCPGCHVCKSHNEYFWNNDGTCETSHKFTGVTLSLVPMVDGDYGFIPPGRDDRVQSLLKSVEIQMNLRR